MKTFRITFSTAIYFDFEAETSGVSEDGREIALYDADGGLVVRYKDSELLSVDEIS